VGQRGSVTYHPRRGSGGGTGRAGVRGPASIAFLPAAPPRRLPQFPPPCGAGDTGVSRAGKRVASLPASGHPIFQEGCLCASTQHPDPSHHSRRGAETPTQPGSGCGAGSSEGLNARKPV